MVSAIVRAGVPAYKGWEGRLPAGSCAGNCVKDTAPGWRMGQIWPYWDGVGRGKGTGMESAEWIVCPE